MLKLGPLLFALLFSSVAHAWGERGHHLVTRVAVRLVAERLGPQSSFADKIAGKELMLAHLANVPDTVWRGAGKEIEDMNAPTHFVDVEYLVSPAHAPAYATFPKTTAEAADAMRKLCAESPKGYVCPEGDPKNYTASVAGTAPWRAQQLHDAMVKALSGGKPEKASIDRAWLMGGLLSHFVGDLGNPHHTSRDYNGWERGQGGIHSYFESEVVSSFDLGLENEVWLSAKRGKHFDRVAQKLPAKERATLVKDPLAVTIALTLDSHARLSQLGELDKKHAVLKASKDEKGLKLRAERRPAPETAKHFKELIVERLATAADTLANLWVAAYEKAGKPDLSTYQSWEYPMQPAFIEPDYLVSAPSSP